MFAIAIWFFDCRCEVRCAFFSCLIYSFAETWIQTTLALKHIQTKQKQFMCSPCDQPCGGFFRFVAHVWARYVTCLCSSAARVPENPYLGFLTKGIMYAVAVVRPRRENVWECVLRLPSYGVGGFRHEHKRTDANSEISEELSRHPTFSRAEPDISLLSHRTCTNQVHM